MSLYPVTIIDAATAGSGNNLMPSSTLLAIPIDMTTIQMTQISMAQLSLTQDYSLRTWVSRYPDGLAINGPFPILRNGGIPFIIYVASQTPPANTIATLVAPGSYFLNILNLTNEQNVLGFSQIDLALSTTLTGCLATGLISTPVPTRIPSTFVGCASAGGVGTVRTMASSPVAGSAGVGHAGTVLTKVSIPFAGCASAGGVGTVLTAYSVSAPVVGAVSTGQVGTISVMTLGIWLTRKRRAWQARHNKH